MDIENECTGFSAQWCPRCGTCRGCNRELHEYSEACPLHGAQSKHAEDPEADPRADYAPRATPPTPAEVRAVAQLQGHGHGVAQVLVRRRVDGDTPHESYVWCAAWVRVIDAEVRPLSVLDRAVTNGEGQWSALGPDGPVAWSQLAAMVAEGVDHG